MLTKRTHVAVNAEALERVKKKFWEFLAMWKLVWSLLNDVADWRLFYNDWHWYSTETLMQKGEPEEEEKQPESVEYSVQPIPERAQWSVFEYQQRWNLKYLVDISKDLASYRKELENSYGTDSQPDAIKAIIWLKFNNRKEWDDLKSIPDKNEPTLYNFFKRKWLNHLVEQIDSLIQFVIDIDNTQEETK